MVTDTENDRDDALLLHNREGKVTAPRKGRRKSRSNLFEEDDIFAGHTNSSKTESETAEESSSVTGSEKTAQSESSSESPVKNNRGTDGLQQERSKKTPSQNSPSQADTASVLDSESSFPQSVNEDAEDFSHCSVEYALGKVVPHDNPTESPSEKRRNSSKKHKQSQQPIRTLPSNICIQPSYWLITDMCTKESDKRSGSYKAVLSMCSKVILVEEDQLNLFVEMLEYVYLVGVKNIAKQQLKRKVITFIDKYFVPRDSEMDE